jgi:hypothetical protein
MCEKCEKYAPVEEKFVKHFSQEMSTWALANELDLMGIRNGLAAMYNTVHILLIKQMAKSLGFDVGASEELSPSIPHREKSTEELKVNVPDISSGDFDSFIFGKDDGKDH